MSADRRYDAVITDMDGTLYSWVDYIVPALEAMIESLVATTHLPRIEIVQALKEVYDRQGSNDYAFAIQESAIFEKFGYDFDSFDALVITPARRAFSERRRRYLQPYRGVREGLDALRSLGVRIIALTDAPRGPAERRLKQLGLDTHVDALYALKGWEVPEQVHPEVKRREASGYYKSAVETVVELDPEHEKPSAAGIERILADFGLSKTRTLVVGDNIKKDLAAAHAAGVVGVWAEYGTYVSPEYLERLRVISASSALKKNLAGDPIPGDYEPEHAISNFGRLVGLVKG